VHVLRLGQLALVAMVLLSGCLPGVEPGMDVQNATLTVTVSGTGNGTVTATSSNTAYATVFGAINCRRGSGTCTASTDLDQHLTTILTLTAVPDTGSRFVGWTTCSPSSADPLQATVNMNSETGYECTATFDLLVPPPACNNPVVLSSDFGDPSVWERTHIATGTDGSFQTSGGHPGAYELEELQRPANGSAEATVYFLRTEVYDPAVSGAVTGILYSEDRIVLTQPLMTGEGIAGGLSIWTQPYPLGGLPVDNGVYYTGNTWTTASKRFDAVPDRTTIPFRVGFWRQIVALGGSGAVQSGIDNVTISICR
jgi:hypothetical protein